MQYLHNLFSSSSKASMMRVCTLLVVVSSCFIGIYAVIENRDLSATGVLVGSMLGFAMGSKAIQSKYEQKNESE